MTTTVIRVQSDFLEEANPECDPSNLIVLDRWKHTKFEFRDYVCIHPDVKAYFRQTRQAANLLELETGKHEKLMNTISEWSPTAKDCAVVTCTRTFVKVQWQDGTMSDMLPATQFIPRDHLLDSDYWPGDFIVRKEMEDDDKEKKVREEKVGFVNKVNFEEQTAMITWMDDKQSEEVSVYDISPHSTFDFRISSVVVSFPLSDVGEVLDTHEGKVHVQWSGKQTTVESPDTLMRIDLSDEDMPGMSEDSFADDSGDFFDSEESGDDGNENASEGKDNSSWFNWLENLVSNVTTFIPGTRTNTTDEGGEDEDEEDSNEDEDEEEEEYNELIGKGKADETDEEDLSAELLKSNELQHDENPQDSHKEENTAPPRSNKKLSIMDPRTGRSITILDDKNTTNPNLEQSTSPQPQPQPSVRALASETQPEEPEEPFVASVPLFQVLEQLPDGSHHFQNTAVDSRNGTLARTAPKEWRTLGQGLPPGAYVCAYAQRVDLMKILIIGPKNTVYHHSYFVFDVLLPPNYPQEPPQVFFNSGGWRLHPNLYAEGKVCLSLLGTWSGDEVENWNPKQSNILQLVVSLQGLILGVKEPYYLEAGYDKQKGTKQGAQSSKLYNERALLLSLKLMAKIYENPPPEFAPVIRQHFARYSSEVILLAQHCARILRIKRTNSKPTESEESEEIQSGRKVLQKFFIPENPSIGFLQPLVQTVLPKFQALTQKMSESNTGQENDQEKEKQEKNT